VRMKKKEGISGYGIAHMMIPQSCRGRWGADNSGATVLDPSTTENRDTVYSQPAITQSEGYNYAWGALDYTFNSKYSPLLRSMTMQREGVGHIKG